MNEMFNIKTILGLVYSTIQAVNQVFIIFLNHLEIIVLK